MHLRLSPILLLPACTPSDGTDDTADTVADRDDSSDSSETPVDTADTGDLPMNASVSGTVLDLGGNAVVDARTNVCREACQFDYTDTDGSYAIIGLKPWPATYYIAPPDGLGLAHPLVPLTLGDAEQRALHAVVPPLDPGRPIPTTAAEVEVTDGLYLTLGVDTLTPAAFTELGDEVAAVLVPEGARLPVEIEGSVVALWYLDPFEATAERGIPVRIDNAWGLPPGQALELHFAHEPYDPGWELAGTLVVSLDGTRLEGDATIGILTTLALIDPAGT
jgi:hypothetical protein